MCGIAGILSQTASVNSDLFDALTMLQHRGQDAAGIITNEGHRLYLRKENGLVRDVFGLDSQVIADPVSGTPLVVPIGRHHTPAATAHAKVS